MTGQYIKPTGKGQCDCGAGPHLRTCSLGLFKAEPRGAEPHSEAGIPGCPKCGSPMVDYRGGKLCVRCDSEFGGAEPSVPAELPIPVHMPPIGMIAGTHRKKEESVAAPSPEVIDMAAEDNTAHVSRCNQQSSDRVASGQAGAGPTDRATFRAELWDSFKEVLKSKSYEFGSVASEIEFYGCLTRYESQFFPVSAPLPENPWPVCKQCTKSHNPLANCGPVSAPASQPSAELENLRHELKAAKEDAASWKRHWQMYRDAWVRELGGWTIPKSHEIDSLVLTTRKRCVNPLLGNCGTPHWLGKPTEDRKALQQISHPRENSCKDWKVDSAEALSAPKAPQQDLSFQFGETLGAKLDKALQDGLKRPPKAPAGQPE